MKKFRKQQSLIKQKTATIHVDEKELRMKTQRKTYSKTINPLKIQIKSLSLKNLETLFSLESLSTQEDQFDDNKSCCCSDCGKETKKAKNVRKRFLPFETKMSVLRKSRLRKRFQSAVKCIIYLIQKVKKFKQQERARRMLRYKTKVFDPSPYMAQKFNHLNQEQLNQYISTEEVQSPNQQVQSIQAQLIDQRHKQRKSVKDYLQQKLSHKQQTNILQKITFSKYNSSSFSNIQLTQSRLFKTLGDEVKTPQQKVFTSPIQPISPYLNHLIVKRSPDSQVTSNTGRGEPLTTNRAMTKSFKQIYQFKTRKIAILKKLE